MPDPIEQNILGVQQLVGSKLNKIPYGATTQVEGVDGDFEDEFTLKLSDDELLALADQWVSNYAGYEGRIRTRQEANKTFYLGRQKEGGANVTTEGQPISANLLFEAEETFLPAALAKNPEPVVWADNTPEGNKLSNDVKTMLQFHANQLVLRRSLTLMTRYWSLDFLGIIKHGWNEEIQEITSEVRPTRNFIFSPTGFIDVYGDYEGPLGERITIPAHDLIGLFPRHREYITVMCDGKLGTDVTYTEWWNDDYCFYTFKGKVLEKNKNPHFNPDKEMPVVGFDGKFEIGEDGKPVMQTEKGNNHFAKPKKPYTFLSVFSLQEQPHDITGLIEQNIPNQRRVSRRTDQIDYNLSRQNNSDIFSENNFNQETAKQAAKAMAQGHPVLIPSGGPIGDSVHRLTAQGLPGEFFQELENSKNDLRSIFGTQGITATQQDEDQTARGMILNQQYDNTRIGGGIGDALEQVADNIFNWWVQLYYVYYDVPHVASIMGQMKAVEYVTLRSQDLDRKIVVSVAPDSMKPHDETSEMNQALSLWEAKALDIKTLLTVLNFPDPQNTAAQVWLYQTNPALYGQLNFPDLANMIAQLNPPMMPQPGQPGQAPPEPGSPPQSMSAPPASAALSNVPINTPAAPAQ